MAGEQPGEGADGRCWGGAAPSPPLSLSSAHPSVSAALLCRRDGAGLSPGAHFTDQAVETLRALGGFAQRPLSGGSRDEPQWVFPILLSPFILTVLCPACKHPLSAKRRRSRAKQRVMPGFAGTVGSGGAGGGWAYAPTAPPVIHPGRPFEPGQEFKPPS